MSRSQDGLSFKNASGVWHRGSDKFLKQVTKGRKKKKAGDKSRKRNRPKKKKKKK